MLMLTRKAGQAIDVTLPDGRIVTVAIQHTQKGSVRIGIEAPSDVQISRPDAKVKTPLQRSAST
jgi:carbon storage regulator CsrA